jgi:prepilin-type N-terminal cleavage/methylation domain-containing protein
MRCASPSSRSRKGERSARRPSPSCASTKARGFSLIEILIALLVFTAVVFSALLLFRGIFLRFGRASAEKTVTQEAAAFFSFMRAHVPEAVVRDVEGRFRIDLVGTGESIRFVAPYTSGDGSDLGQFGCRLHGGQIQVSYTRLTAHMRSYAFPDGFPGAQKLAGGVKRLSFSYWDGAAWSHAWDSGAPLHRGRLPVKLRMTVTFTGGSVEGREITKEFTDEIFLGY